MSARVMRIAGQVSVVDDADRPVGSCAAFLDRYLVRGLSRSTVEAYAYDLALIHRWLEVEELELAQVGYINISMVDVAAEFERAAKNVEARYVVGGAT